MHIIRKQLCFLLFFAVLAFPRYVFSKVEKIQYRGWSECYRIYNDIAEVIVVAESGGRVLVYSVKDRNIIYENPAQNGAGLSDYKADELFQPDGGRFDWGPERQTENAHALSWMGVYTAEIVDDYTLRLTGPDDMGLGIKTFREFTLDSATSRLSVINTMVNISDQNTRWCYWGRTLVKKGGSIIIPLSTGSSYPQGWGRFFWSPEDHIRYEGINDKQLTIIDSTLVYHAKSGSGIKIGADSDKGWIAYHHNDQLFVTKYPYYPDQEYTEKGGFSAIFYIGKQFAEIEPLGPQAILEPGESYSFEERWWLLEDDNTISGNDPTGRLNHLYHLIKGLD